MMLFERPDILFSIFFINSIKVLSILLIGNPSLNYNNNWTSRGISILLRLMNQLSCIESNEDISLKMSGEILTVFCSAKSGIEEQQ